MVSQISMLIVQSGPFKNSLVALSTRTTAELADEDEDDEKAVAGSIIGSGVCGCF